MHRREFLWGAAAGLSGWAAATDRRIAPPVQDANITIDTRSEGVPLPHYWENCVGSDRLAVGLREQWLQDLISARDLCGFRSVRCHGLFDEEMGICQAVSESGPV